MSGKGRGTAPIRIDGADYVLHVDFNTIADLEQAFGRPAHKLFGKGVVPGLWEVREMLFHALQEKHSKDFPNTRALGAVMLPDEVSSYAASLRVAMSRFQTGKDPDDTAGDGGDVPLSQQETVESGTGTDS
jgi:hypothetical protein